ncbi:hypothetical protein CP968_05625 [Streptomyces subrutilus]|uniref:Uncharacterized protein n=1 Tax=Streptomyces subrutilus TaxID=36818 RepID=A0A5P2UEX4_9ACTN|nr:hypothetical protein CP968_05625 [Streptomyces subrutilus]
MQTGSGSGRTAVGGGRRHGVPPGTGVGGGPAPGAGRAEPPPGTGPGADGADGRLRRGRVRKTAVVSRIGLDHSRCQVPSQ